MYRARSNWSWLTYAAASLHRCCWNPMRRLSYDSFRLSSYLSYALPIRHWSLILIFLLLAHLEFSSMFIRSQARPRVPEPCVDLIITELLKLRWLNELAIQFTYRHLHSTLSWFLGSSPLSCPCRSPTHFFANCRSAPASIIFIGFYTLAHASILNARRASLKLWYLWCARPTLADNSSSPFCQ